jgi:hypothetical protein
MRKTNKKLKITDANVRRVAKRLQGGGTAALFKLLWQKPKVFIGITEDRCHIEFRYPIPVPPILSPTSVSEFLFGGRNKYLEESLKIAYREEKTGNKTVDSFISNFLRRVCKNAFHICIESLWSLQDPKEKQRHLGEFDKNSIIKRSQPDPRLALWITNEISTLVPAIKRLRDKAKTINNYERMERCVVPPLSPSLLRKALGRITPSSPGLRGFYVASDKRIAEQYVQCALEEAKINLGKPSFRSYIRAGQSIADAFSTLSEIDKQLLGTNPPLDVSD